MNKSNRVNLITNHNKKKYPVLSVEKSITSIHCRYCNSESINIYGVVDLNDFSVQMEINFCDNFNVLTIFYCSACGSYFSINNTACLIRPYDVLGPEDLRTMDNETEIFLELKHSEEKGIRRLKNKTQFKYDTFTQEATDIICEANIALNMGFDDLAGAGYRKAIELISYNLAKENGISTSTKNGGTLGLKQLLEKLKKNLVITESRYQKMLSITYLGNDMVHAGIKKHEKYTLQDMKELIYSLLEDERLNKKILDITE